ncbi:radical SAM/SPASM family putative metalloenzyme maturase [Anaeromyxobacter oryzae]|uniref:Radical SAM protein n=1 Tax=Anaeromyxobacter oryzae TaxID=2918170 RepID=A0ABM7X174_9BACT|nr:radical SAM/SPASM family putative metalloenzyme maturase [Anaeromyxobacter oryzae]BDG05553.1 radical SAM protein [Anaeromyxobacter oryzae]
MRSVPDAAQPTPRALRPHPSKLFVEVTTRCNLRCAMCVKESSGQGIPEGHMTRETFARLAPALPHLDALVLNGIGEPLLHPHLEHFVELARRDMPSAGWIGFQTNGQLLGPTRARALARAGVDRICLSADAVTPELFGALRGGGRHDAVERAAASLHDAARERGRPIVLGVEFVAMRDNLDQLPHVVRWAARRRFGFMIVTHMLPYAEETRGAAAFDPSTDRAREVFLAWSARAAAEGVDLRRYFDVFLKFRPTPADRRVVSLVKDLVADAAAQGISLSVDRLLRADEALRRRVSEAFAEADAIARAEGLELKLPAITPTRARRCEFVEDGAAFVSWDGGVHPCYFLWHRYSCHVGGLVKHVHPRSFGSVAREELLALWRGDASRGFREEVLRYEFPFCYDCSVGLCDYVQPGDAAADCHVGAVPCGACLWCTGVFRCLQ